MGVYRHRKSGQEITTPCEISGENWERVDMPAPSSGESGTAKTKKGGAKDGKRSGTLRDGK